LSLYIIAFVFKHQ